MCQWRILNFAPQAWFEPCMSFKVEQGEYNTYKSNIHVSLGFFFHFNLVSNIINNTRT